MFLIDLHPECVYKHLTSNSEPSLTLPNSVKRVQESFFNERISFDTALKEMEFRRSVPSYLFFKRHNENGSFSFVKAKASVRGNDVYRVRTYSRHAELLKFCELNEGVSFINPESVGHSCGVLKFTLTANPSHFDMVSFNSHYVNYFLDLFVKRLRNIYGDIVVCRSFEVSKKKARGFIHVNVVVLFLNKMLPVFRHESKKRSRVDGKPVVTWRLSSFALKESFAELWDCGFLDVRAVVDSHDLAEYVLKYFVKEFHDKEAKDNQSLTLSTLSLFSKRSFSFPLGSAVRGSHSFVESVINFVIEQNYAESGETGVSFPRLDTIPHNSLEFEFLGIFLDLHGEYDRNIWSELVDKPPPEIDESPMYEDIWIEMGVSVVMCSFDSGSRLDENGQFVKELFVPPKFTRQNRFKTGFFESHKRRV